MKNLFLLLSLSSLFFTQSPAFATNDADDGCLMSETLDKAAVEKLIATHLGADEVKIEYEGYLNRDDNPILDVFNGIVHVGKDFFRGISDNVVTYSKYDRSWDIVVRKYNNLKESKDCQVNYNAELGRLTISDCVYKDGTKLVKPEIVMFPSDDKPYECKQSQNWKDIHSLY